MPGTGQSDRHLTLMMLRAAVRTNSKLMLMMRAVAGAPDSAMAS